MAYVNEKLLRLVLVLVGLSTLGGFGWKMYDFVQHQDSLVRKLSMAQLESTFGAIESARLGGHLLPYERYKVLQDLNITGYVPPPPVVETSDVQKPKPRIAPEDIEVPWIQAPTAAWIQGRGERSTDQVIAGDLLTVGQKFQLATKAGLDLQLLAVKPGEVQIKVLDSGEVLQVHAFSFEVDSSQVFASALSSSRPIDPQGRSHGGVKIPTPQTTQEIEPGVYAVGQQDVAQIQEMSQEEILSAVPLRLVRDPLSKEVRGLRIRRIPEGSVFARLGLRADDIVLEVNGEPTVDRDQLFASLREMDTDTLRVKVERLGGVRQLTFRLPR